jgi:hypothetical protein
MVLEALQYAHSVILLAGSAAPTPGTTEPGIVPVPGLSNFADSVLGWLKWILILGGTGGFIACGIMMAIGRRGRSQFAADGASGIPWVAAGIALGAIASGLTMTILNA